MKSSAKKIELASVDDLFSTEEGRQDAKLEKIQEIPLSELHPFRNHPFKVKDDEAMMETADSIKQYGVLVPAIARPDPEGGYELVPKCLVDCLRETKENSISDYVIADSKGEPLAASQFQRVWQYVVVRSTKPRNYYKYVNGQSIKYTVTPTLGMTQKNQPQIRYTLDFDVTPHQLRHTYITNLLYAGVDPKTVQYLAGHENSKTTMDIYAKVKYNKPEELFGVVNGAFHQAIAE